MRVRCGGAALPVSRRAAACWRGCLLHLVLLFLATVAVTGFTPEGTDPYEVLGLERGAPLDAGRLKKAYRQAALQSHPDKVPESERKAAEQRFIAIAWAYEVLSDPAQRGRYAQPPSPPPQGDGAGAEQGAGAGHAETPEWERSFSMKSAAKVFRDVFGTQSDAYKDLVQHLMMSATAGDQEHWREHAEALKLALDGSGGNFKVKTKTQNGHISTSQTVTNDGQGTVTKKTVTSSSHTSSSGNAGHPQLHHAGMQHGLHPDKVHRSLLEAHQRDHEEAVRKMQRQHEAMHGGHGSPHSLEL